MKNERFLRRISSAALTAALAVTTIGAMPVLAASSKDTTNDTAVSKALTDSDIIDMSKTGSISIFKYDMTSAQFDGVWEGAADGTVTVTKADGTKVENINATGEANSTIEAAMADYAIQGVEFSYVYLGQVEQYSYTSGGVTEEKVVYEIDDELQAILGLNAADATDMTADGVAEKCENDKLHYTSSQLQEALSALLADNNTAAKNALEQYAEAHRTGTFADTDAAGKTSVDGLTLGLYLIVETEVPEEVTSTTNPWLVSVPFTNISDGTTTGGEQWLYDATCYPKNETGNPTIDKMVRNAFGTADDKGVYSTDYIISTNDSNVDADSEHAANTGFYNFASTTTASAGDVLDFIVVSKLPAITSEATYLTQYSFADELGAGLTYNKDAKIFLSRDYDATANTFGDMLDITANVAVTYADDTDGTSSMSVVPNADALATINTTNATADAYQYIVVAYSATVNSDAELVMGDDGNANDVSLTWERTSEDYTNTIEDRTYVYSYGLDLTKYFSDNAGDYSKVQFILYNRTDGYYVVADTVDATAADGKTYYVDGTTNGDVTGTALGKTTDKAKATVFTPDTNGKIFINGLEADQYDLIEIATDDGYKLLADSIDIQINTASREIRPSVAGYVGNDAAAVGNTDATKHVHSDACKDERGYLICGNAALETANGRTIGKTAMFVGDVVSGTASVDGVTTQMGADDDSLNATVALEITNTKTFFFPMTGGNGTILFTLAGGVVALIGVAVVSRRKKEEA